VLCDEYYALLSQAEKEDKKAIERSIGLLGAKARASGIHMVLAMQQASRKIIQGSIDTNIPCRVALMTSSAIESRMVLQSDGADQLTGYGDLLYKDIGEPVRLQAAYLAPERRDALFARVAS
jgi:DNA segregation ATPase FtsK/SpoIIIE, S-DNA-T family